MKNNKRLVLMIGSLLALPLALAQWSDPLQMFGQTLFGYLNNQYVMFGMSVILYFMLLYGIIASAFTKIKTFSKDGKVTKQGKIVAIAISLLSTIGIFAFNGQSSIKDVLTRVIGPFGIFAGLLLAIVMFMMIYLAFRQEDKDNKHWDLAMLIAGFAMVMSGHIISYPNIQHWGWFIFAIGLIVFIIAKLTNMGGTKKEQGPPGPTGPTGPTGPPGPAGAGGQGDGGNGGGGNGGGGGGDDVDFRLDLNPMNPDIATNPLTAIVEEIHNKQLDPVAVNMFITDSAGAQIDPIAGAIGIVPPPENHKFAAQFDLNGAAPGAATLTSTATVEGTARVKVFNFNINGAAGAGPRFILQNVLPAFEAGLNPVHVLIAESSHQNIDPAPAAPPTITIKDNSNNIINPIPGTERILPGMPFIFVAQFDFTHAAPGMAVITATASVNNAVHTETINQHIAPPSGGPGPAAGGLDFEGIYDDGTHTALPAGTVPQVGEDIEIKFESSDGNPLDALAPGNHELTLQNIDNHGNPIPGQPPVVFQNIAITGANNNILRGDIRILPAHIGRVRITAKAKQGGADVAGSYETLVTAGPRPGPGPGHVVLNFVDFFEDTPAGAPLVPLSSPPRIGQTVKVQFISSDPANNLDAPTPANHDMGIQPLDAARRPIGHSLQYDPGTVVIAGRTITATFTLNLPNPSWVDVFASASQGGNRIDGTYRTAVVAAPVPPPVPAGGGRRRAFGPGMVHP